MIEINELIGAVKESGVCGAGGAGFPSYGKIDARAKTIILNCAECEPLLRLHRQVLEKYPYEILSTLYQMALSIGCNQVIIGVKEAYRHTVEAIHAHLRSFPIISIGLLPEVYPAGDEVVMIHELTGKVVPPGSIPIQVGVAVFNVETVFNIYQALNAKRPVTHKFITITGEVKEPCTRYVPLGMSVEGVVALAGGVTTQEPVYLMGGPMTGNLCSPYDLITKTSNAVIVLPENHLVVQKKRKNTQISMKRAMASCCQCEMCTDLCPRNLLGHPIQPHLFMRAATTGTTRDVGTFLNTFFCSSCGLCEMYSCNQELTPRSLIAEYKAGLRANGVKPPKVEAAAVKKSRPLRRVPISRLRARLGLDVYNVKAPLDESYIIVDHVRIKLSQHIGAPAVPIVQVGDVVKEGQKIGEAAENALSLPVHASIDGVVTSVNAQEIEIRVRK